MTALSKSLAIVCLCTQLAPAAAERVVVDEMLTSQPFHAIELGWEPSVIAGAIAALMSGATDAAIPMTGRLPGVEVRLDTRAFTGEDVRIFLTIPTTVIGLANPEDLELRWEAAGRFLSGAARPGQSALIFAGTIEQAVTIAVFDFALLLQGSPESETFELEPFYEIEIGL